MRERIRNYELMFIISPLHATDDEVDSIIQRIQNSIENAQGEILSVNHNSPWGRRKLAYPIRAYAGGEASRRSFNEGYYVLMHFSMTATRLDDLEQTIKFTDPILRHLVTLVEGDIPTTTTTTTTADEDTQAPPKKQSRGKSKGNTRNTNASASASAGDNASDNDDDESESDEE